MSIASPELASGISHAANACAPADTGNDVEISQAVAAYTAQLFSGEVALELVRDAEFGDQSFLVAVQAHGTVDQLIDKSDQWHRNLHSVAKGQAYLYGLSIFPLDESK